MIYGIEEADELSVVRFENCQQARAERWQEGSEFDHDSGNFETRHGERQLYQMPPRWSPKRARSAAQLAGQVKIAGKLISAPTPTGAHLSQLVADVPALPGTSGEHE